MTMNKGVALGSSKIEDVFLPAENGNEMNFEIAIGHSISHAMGERYIALSQESALTEIDRMKDVRMADTGGVTLYSGVHPDHGHVHVVVPAMGESLLLLPFVTLVSF